MSSVSHTTSTRPGNAKKMLSVDFGMITKDNIEQLRLINTTSFPVQYQESFYENAAKDKEDYNKFAYWNGFVVGAICCRLEDMPLGVASSIGAESTPQRLYIMTLAVLAAYRGRGIGSQLLESVLDYVEKENAQNDKCRIEEVALHVQVSNQDALHFYEDNFGFTRGEMVENYYKRIDPPHCYLLFKKL